MEFNQNDKKYSEDYFDQVNSENETIIKKLNSELSEKNIIISRTKSYLFDLEFDLNKAKNKISSLEADLAKNTIEINSKDNKIRNFNSQIENNKLEIDNLFNQINSLEGEFVQKDNQICSLESDLAKREIEVNNLLNQINSLENELNQNEKKYVQQVSKLDTKEYCISRYEEKMNDDALEIEYLKKNVLIKKFLSPFTYLYLVFKSKPNEISINFKLYKAIKDSKCFNVGYYLNNNNDLVESRWCKYFSPELHYVCNGFEEGRKFNKKYYNRHSKKELLDYISNCA